MFEFFWVRTASVWIAALYLMMGLALLLFPAAGSTLFIWALAAGAGIYGAGHLIRWFQGRKAGRENPGDLFLTLLPAAFAAFALIWPRAVLSVLPLVLGSLLLVDGVGKLPLAVHGLRVRAPGMVPLALSSVLPMVLGTVIILNPFATAQVAVMVFGASLIADGASDLATLILEHRGPRPAVASPVRAGAPAPAAPAPAAPAAPAATTPEPAKAPAEPDTTPKAPAEPGGEKQESGT